jgi:putative endonuclease
MARHNETGKKGELQAATWLKEQNYDVLYVNWRHSHYEIDIIASRYNVLHFIEVKTRNSIAFGYPEEDVSKKKLDSLMNAAEEFLIQNPGWKRIQYDVLSITKRKDHPLEFFLIEDVYDGNL